MSFPNRAYITAFLSTTAEGRETSRIHIYQMAVDASIETPPECSIKGSFIGIQIVQYPGLRRVMNP